MLGEKTRVFLFRNIELVIGVATKVYFLNGVIVQAIDVLSRAERINQLVITWRVKVGSESSSLVADILNQLAVNPFLTIKKIAIQFKVAFTTAQRAIQKLKSLAILNNIGERKRDRFYCTTQILNILERANNNQKYLFLMHL